MAKTIAIIGAGPGVGLAVAERFGKEGYQVALLSINEEVLETLVSRLHELGISAASFQVDILDKDHLHKALLAVKERFGTIDVIEFSPAPPVTSMKSPRNIDVLNAQFHLDFQVLAAITTVQAVLPEMLERREGSLLFTTAASAQSPISMTASFGVAAGALLNYVKLLNKDLAQDNIFAGIICSAALVYVDDPNVEALKFLPGLSVISAKEIAELHWQLHTKRNEFEVVVGDMAAFQALG